MRLSDSAVLVQLSISQWTARKHDRRASEEVASSHGTTVAAGRYHKSLLPANDALRNVHLKTDVIRKQYYTNTLPWGIEGTQLLPSSNYLAFMAEFRQYKAEWNSLVDTFIREYPVLQINAKTALRGLYNKEDYPDPAVIHRRFRMELVVSPVPEGDFRVKLSEDELEVLKHDVEQRVQAAAGEAMTAVWKRLYDKVQHIAGKLADPKAIFRDSMLENAQELCNLLPRLNFADDPNLELMRRQVESQLLGHHPDALRNDPDLRRDTAQQAELIMKVMSGVIGETT